MPAARREYPSAAHSGRGILCGPAPAAGAAPTRHFPGTGAWANVRRMHRSAFRRGGLALLAGLVLAAGCGRGRERSQDRALTFEMLPDTSGLSAGAPLVTDLDAVRVDGGGLCVKGRTRLPEGTRLQVAVKRPGQSFTTGMTRLSVHDGAFESPPLFGESGPLPQSRWRFEVRAEFSPEAQPAEVLRATQSGRALRGPGITRTRLGDPIFLVAEELNR